MERQLTVLLVDDHAMVRSGFAMVLSVEDDIEVVGEAADGLEAIERARATRPDVVLMDVQMPRMDGMELLRRVRETSSMPVIFLTSKDDELDEALGLAMGADDYIAKPFSQRLLVARIRALLRRRDLDRGQAAQDGETEREALIERGRLTMDPARHKIRWDGKDVTLTVTEFLILEALAQRSGVVKSRNQLLDVAYQDDVYVDDRTIDSHIKRIRRKFRTVDGEFDAIETLYGVGYRFGEE